ncbi:MAG: hypothetical protein K5739_07775 [Lachnospiraceae bacterium]|nr:hypothetical protein [Lachnospiraceae bacterium]
MTRGEIYFNYEKAMSQVRALQEIASSIKKISDSNMTDCMNNVKKNWEGDNATSYVGKGNKLKEKIKKSGENVDRVASTLAEMARNIRDAELRNLEIIEQKNSSSGG